MAAHLCEDFDEFPDVDAQFPGGSAAFIRYVTENLEFSNAQAINCTSGNVYLSFIVNKNGSVSNVTIERGIDQECDESTVRLIEQMPNWIPAESGGKLVCTKVLLPIRIHLQ